MKCTIKAKANIHRKGGCVAWSEHGTVPQLISGGDLKSRDPGEAEAASSLRTSTFPDPRSPLGGVFGLLPSQPSPLRISMHCIFERSRTTNICKLSIWSIGVTHKWCMCLCVWRTLKIVPKSTCDVTQLHFALFAAGDPCTCMISYLTTNECHI